MKRFPVGARVFVTDPEYPTQGRVVRNGRNVGGIYTRIAFDDGRVEDFHREYVRPAPSVVRDGALLDGSGYGAGVHSIGCACESCSAQYERDRRDPRDGE